MYRGFVSSIRAARHPHKCWRADNWGRSSIVTEEQDTTQVPAPPDATDDGPVSREALYEMVWSEPMRRVAARFGVSSSYMARVCTLLNVPRPERGYWAKLAVGKAPKKPPLPEPRPGDPIEWTRDGALPKRARSLPRPPDQRPRRKPAARRQLPERHPLVSGAKPLFEAGRLSWHGKYLKPAKKLLVDLAVTQTGLDKAIAFANELFLALEARDYRVVIAPNSEQFHRADVDERENPGKGHHHNDLWSPMRCTVVYIGTVAIGLTVVEMSEAAEARYVNGEYVRLTDYVPKRRGRYAQDYGWTSTHDFPTGRLCLSRPTRRTRGQIGPSSGERRRIGTFRAGSQPLSGSWRKPPSKSRGSSRRGSARRRSNANAGKLSTSAGVAKRRCGGPRGR
jgi:hypothetical protein